MDIQSVVVEKAKAIVCQQGNKLTEPQKLSDTPLIYVARLEDGSVRSAGTFECGGVFFKFGPLKQKAGALT